MTVRVDAAAGVVAEDDRHWPLRLDCRTGTAVLRVGDREITVAPVRWRDKQRLARWAHLGPAFVTEHSVDLAVAPGTELDEHTRPLVAAVAAFLDSDALPLSPELLAGVTVELCRLTGLAPAAFDDRDAADVEAAWRCAGTQPPPEPMPVQTSARPGAAPAHPPADPWADATRIEITADPPHPGTPAPASPSTATREPQIPAAPSAPAVPATAAGATPVPDPEPAPPPRVEAPAHISARSPGPARSPARSDRRRDPLPYRIAPVSAPTPAHPTPVAAGIGTPPHGTSPAPQARVGGPLVAPAAEPPTPRTALDAATGAPGLPNRVDVAEDGDELAALTAAVADRLAEQLTRAGADLGIEV
jgi:hypothetical protein